MPWRAEDEALLERLEDEILLERLWAFFVGSFSGSGAAPAPPHPRAAGMVAELRKLPKGAEAVAGALRTSPEGGDVVELAGLIDGLVMKECSPQLLHHLALFHSRAATALERFAPDAAATAWVRALAAWLALAEEGDYLSRLEGAVLGEAQRSRAASEAGHTPPRGPLELVNDVARRAEATARDLGPAGTAALLALARTDEAARIAGASDATAKRARVFAQRHRNAAIEAALAVIGEALDEANVRGELTSSGRILLLRAIAVWSWTSNDEAVEHFVVDRVDRIGWELYRARNWDALRYLLDPFRPMFDSLARRIERDPSQIAYAAGCAQMFVFVAEVERTLERKLENAERAVRICPTHRNGRLVLASALCDQAIHAMRSMVVFAPKKEVERVEAILKRATALYPETSSLPEATRMLDRLKSGRITV